MSYDLTIRPNSQYTTSVAYELVKSIVTSQSDVTGTGPGFTFSQPSGLHMEIDCELVTSDGDSDGDPQECGKVNCISLHIPYGYLDEHMRAYLTCAVSMASALQWQLYDHQTDCLLLKSKTKRPWWRIWYSS